MACVILTHPDCALHEMGAHHPESPARLHAVMAALDDGRVLGHLREEEAPRASVEQLARVHHDVHIDFVHESAPERDYAFLDPDTSLNPKSLSASLRAAGAVARAADIVMEGSHTRSFCAERPPGQHATPSRAMGFCVFNNVAVGAAQALERHGLERIAILDFDVHHGNGTEDMFHDDPRVLFCSTFQHPYYPYCGADSGNDHVINVPLPAMTGSEGFRAAVERHWMPALERFEPQLVFISAGFDAHREDPLAYLQLEDEDYGWVTRRIVEVAERHAGGRIVSTLEGGYNTASLARSALQHVRMLGA